MTVWTMGYSTRTWGASIDVLQANQIDSVLGVRRFPGSRKFPWFGSDAMSALLPREGIGYHWVPS